MSTNLVPASTGGERYEQINDWEQELTEGTTVVKFFLHIDRDEQRERLQARLDDPTKQLEVQPGRPQGARASGTTT